MHKMHKKHKIPQEAQDTQDTQDNTPRCVMWWLLTGLSVVDAVLGALVLVLLVKHYLVWNTIVIQDVDRKTSTYMVHDMFNDTSQQDGQMMWQRRCQEDVVIDHKMHNDLTNKKNKNRKEKT